MTSAKTVFFNEIYTPIHLINFLFLVFFLQDEYYLPDLSETQEQKISGNDPMNAWGDLVYATTGRHLTVWF